MSFNHIRPENKTRTLYRRGCDRHVVQFELDISEDEKRRLFAMNERVRKAGNEMTGTMKRRIKQMKRTKAYKTLQKDYSWHAEHLKQLSPKSAAYKAMDRERKEIAKQMSAMQQDYGITAFDLYDVAAEAAKNYSIPSTFARTRAEDIWQGIEKILYQDGSFLHFRKYGDLPIMRVKDIVRIIIPKISREYGDLQISVTGFDKPMRLLIPPSDTFLVDEYNAILDFLEHPEQEANAVRWMEITGEIVPVFRPCFCSIQCEEIRGCLRCFLRITIAAPAMSKKDRFGRPRHTKGTGRVANDIGTQSVAIVSDGNAELVNLGERTNGGADKYTKRKKFLYQRLDQSRRGTNPGKYNTDGTYKKGSRGRWNRSAAYRRAEHELKEICRKEAATRLYANRELASHVRSLGDVLITEPSNSRGLSRRSKVSGRQEKTTTVVKKDGTTAEVHKCKRKKRFGSSIAKRSPAGYQAELKKKFGTGYHEVPGRTYRASQYDFESDSYTKKKLSERWHRLPDGRSVQRDLMSAFLMYCADDNIDTIDRSRCLEKFEAFFRDHESCMQYIRENSLKILNSGIRAA